MSRETQRVCPTIEQWQRIRPQTLADLNRDLDKHTEWCNSHRRRKALGWRTSHGYLVDREWELVARQIQPAPKLTETLIVPIQQAA